MRALTIAIALLLISAGVNIVNEAYGGSPTKVNPPVQPYEAKGITEGTELGVIKGIRLALKILGGAVLIGSTVASLSPYPVPVALTTALNAVGVVAYVIAIIQLVRGVPGGGME